MQAGTDDADAALEAGHWLRQKGRDEEAITLYRRAARTGGRGQAVRSATSLLRRNGRTGSVWCGAGPVVREGRTKT